MSEELSCVRPKVRWRDGFDEKVLNEINSSLLTFTTHPYLETTNGNVGVSDRVSSLIYIIVVRTTP